MTKLKEVSAIVDVPGYGAVWVAGGRGQNILGEAVPDAVVRQAAVLWLTEHWPEPARSEWRSMADELVAGR